MPTWDALASLQEAQDQIQPATFYLLCPPDNEQVLGTGFFFAEGLALTAAHCLEDGAPEYAAVCNGKRIVLKPSQWRSEKADVAVLELAPSDPPVPITPLKTLYLDPAVSLAQRRQVWGGRSVVIFGYPARGSGADAWRIDGIVDAAQAVVESVESGAGETTQRLLIYGSRIRTELGGISGAPIWDRSLRAVIGVEGSYNEAMGDIRGTEIAQLADVFPELGGRFERLAVPRREERPAISWFVRAFSGAWRRFEKDSLVAVRNEHRAMNVAGLRVHGPFAAMVEDQFIELRVEPAALAKLSSALSLNDASGRPASEEWAKRETIWALLESHLPSFRFLAVIGPPGSGKSTLLQNIALKLSGEDRPPQFSKTTPVLLPLRKVKDPIAAESPLASVIEEYCKDKKEGLGLTVPIGWFEERLRKGRCLVLIDGLDEVADPTRRMEVAAWVDRQMALYGSCRFIVTSRPMGYRSNPLGHVTTLEVLPFTTRQIQEFVQRWYLSTEIAYNRGDDNPGVRRRAEQGASDLMARLRAMPALFQLAENPLLLTMITLVNRFKGQLPGRRVELYNEICDVFLGHWRTALGLPPKLTVAQRRAILEPLAFAMMLGKTREIKAEAAAGIARPLLAQLGGSQGSTPEEFFTDVEKDSGLLVHKEEGVLAFAHLTFQEYLAACHILESLGVEWIAEGSRVTDSWWRETALLVAAQSDASPIIAACLLAAAGQERIPALTLAHQCMEEAKRVKNADVRRHLDSQLQESADSDDPEERRLVGEVLLSLRLPRFLALSGLDDGAQIDGAYVSGAEYQLFVEEQAAHGHARAPRGWAGQRLPKGTGLRPVAGVRYDDAVAFADWLNERVRSAARQGRFRLPTLQEVEQNPMPRGDDQDRLRALKDDSVGTWCRADPPVVAGLRECLARAVPGRDLPSAVPELDFSLMDVAQGATTDPESGLPPYQKLDPRLAPLVYRGMARAQAHPGPPDDLAERLTQEVARQLLEAASAGVVGALGEHWKWLLAGEYLAGRLPGIRLVCELPADGAAE